MTEPYYSDDWVTLHAGDCLDVLATLPDDSVDAVVTDPPYGLANTTPAQVADTITRWVNGERDYLPSARGFMGHEWDGFVPPVAVWDECLRVLKPGGHLLVFAGPRTMDLMGLGIRLAGFDIRDSIAWLYGSGFPKSLDVSKAIDKAAGADREVVGQGAAFGRGSLRNRSRVEQGYRPTELNPDGGSADITAPATPEAERWQGWGTALKPGHEPIILARKPFPSTVAANVLEHGTGALNIDGCRIGTSDKLGGGANTGMTSHTRHEGFARPWMDDEGARNAAAARSRENTARAESLGRWPANVALDETQAGELDQQSGQFAGRTGMKAATPVQFGVGIERSSQSFDAGNEDFGGASRFFYTAKADSKERPRVPRRVLRLRDDLTPEQADHVRARLIEAGVKVD